MVYCFNIFFGSFLRDVHILLMWKVFFLLSDVLVLGVFLIYINIDSVFDIRIFIS